MLHGRYGVLVPAIGPPVVVSHVEQLWPDAEVGPWHVKTTWTRVDGRAECVGVSLWHGIIPTGPETMWLGKGPALNTGLAILDKGGLFGIYPEGTRSPDGRLYRGKTGVARTAIETGAPVVPVAMVYRPRTLPLGLGKRLMAVEVRFGRPLDFSRYEGLSGDRFVERSITDEIMYEIMTLSGQEYVDVYGAQVKKSMDESGASATEAVGELQPPLEEAGDRRPETLAG